MIRLIDRLPIGFYPDNSAAVRVISLFNAYSKHDIALFWAQYDGDTPTAVISRMDGDITVCALKGADIHEIAQFIAAVGAASVLSNIPLPLKEGRTVAQLEFEPTALHNCEQDSIKETYKIMSTCFDMPGFDVWYADMSHRVRHGTAVAVCSDCSAACGIIAGEAALIVGLCTHLEHRGKGEGTVILNKVINAANAKRCFVLAERTVSDFYVNYGFARSGEHYLYDGDV